MVTELELYIPHEGIGPGAHASLRRFVDSEVGANNTQNMFRHMQQNLEKLHLELSWQRFVVQRPELSEPPNRGSIWH
jgi:hypothetical protein